MPLSFWAELQLMNIAMSLDDYFEMPNWYVDSILLYLEVKAEYEKTQKKDE